MNENRRIDRLIHAAIIAKTVSLRATCGRKKVGAILLDDGRVVASAYNGPPTNQPHCNSKNCDLSKSCERSVHAEINLIAFCAKNGIVTEGKTLVLTLSPCKKCALACIQAGIRRIHYIEEFRDDSGIICARDNGIMIEKIGYGIQELEIYKGLENLTKGS